MTKFTPLSIRQANGLLLLAAIIWGFAFVAQRMGAEHVGPLTFNAIRFALGALVLLPLLLLPGTKHPGRSQTVSLAQAAKKGWPAGLALFAGALFQQLGLSTTTAGNAGFITGLYVVIVPIIGLFLGQKARRLVWLGALLSIVGMWLLTNQGSAQFGWGDGLVLIGSFFWAAHVVVIDRLVKDVAPLQLAIVQFALVAILNLMCAFVFESMEWQTIRLAAIPILYAGIVSAGVGFTLQIIGQTKAKPAHAALIVSLEAVFAAFAGWLILTEALNGSALVGCGMMLGGVMISQLPTSPSAK